MQARRACSRVAVALLVLTLPGCSGSPSPKPGGAFAGAVGTPAPTRQVAPSVPPSVAVATASPTAAASAKAWPGPAGEDSLVETFPAGEFGKSATITNR